MPGPPPAAAGTPSGTRAGPIEHRAGERQYHVLHGEPQRRLVAAGLLRFRWRDINT